MSVLNNLEPRAVFHYFEALSPIPRGSGNTAAVSGWLVRFARERGLEVHQDRMGNVVIIREAAPGYEAAEPVILQGHMDMVCERAPGCRKDMAREGLDLRTDGKFVWAEGTTLGGDDGAAVAMELALLDSPHLAAPRIEAVFTVDEEVGMLGAAGFDPSPLKGRRMVNLDSEAEGVFTVSCAGGNLSRCALPVSRAPFGGQLARLCVSGLTGGHSGSEILHGRANADILLGRLLQAMTGKTSVRLVSVSGGLKDNAIPTAAEGWAVVSDFAAAESAVTALAASLKAEYSATDPALAVSLAAQAPEKAPFSLPLDEDSTRRLVCLLVCAPNGVAAMSHDMPGLVQTSLNLGILATTETEAAASFCVRSSVDSQKAMLTGRLACLTEQLGGSFRVSGDYAAWQYRKDSPLRELMTEVFTEQYGRPPVIESIHAGVECGMFAGKLPELDCVSIGPNLTEIHTFREKLEVASMRRVWDFVVELLRRMR